MNDDRLAELVDELEASIRFEAPARAHQLGTGEDYQVVFWPDAAVAAGRSE